jgi:hypothetical protein
LGRCQACYNNEEVQWRVPWPEFTMQSVVHEKRFRCETYEAARAIVVEHAGGYGIGLDYARDMIKPA